ncbi:16S rRNA processing protein RimM [Conexibacter sp. W3-3-2]|uniref:Ribosome maturation factor RimM n=1 Tax=Paraconexibacter algicola TaxID=2133960 RepID=A0A2T4UD17_9ACTN|nr:MULTISPECIES: ribosome maturation factor RimM [Solirubrobacterales]MTD43458.1 16S rRNA processing protein RimM [Conexibacter sp. W3-3-2]PTL55396.1 16S rRNA processing protein RimM [Paraconexibacter algicola]
MGAVTEPFLSAGRVGRPHGLDGSFHVTRPRPLLLGLGATVHVDGTATTVERRAGTDDRPILRLAAATTREAVLALRGQDLLVAREDLPELPEGEYWAEDLAGCAVVDGDRPVGVVVRMLPLPSCEVLEVRREGAPELLVPMVRDAIRTIDVAARRVDVDLAFLEGQEV